MSANTEDTKNTWIATQHNDWLYAVCRDPKLPHRASVLGAASAFQLGRKGTFRASLRELADAAGMGDRIARRAIAELRDAGYWRVTMRPGRLAYQIELTPQQPGEPIYALEWHETLAQERRYKTKDRTAAEGYEEKADVLRALWRDPHTSMQAKRVGASAIYRLAGHRSAFHAQTDELYAVSGVGRKVARPAIAELAARHYWHVEPIAASVASDKYTLLSPIERRGLWRKAEKQYAADVQSWLWAEERYIKEWSEGLQSFLAELREMERQPYREWFAAEDNYIAQCNEWLTAEFNEQDKFCRRVFEILTFAGINDDEAFRVADRCWTEYRTGGGIDAKYIDSLVAVMNGIQRVALDESRPGAGQDGHHSAQRLEPTAAEVAAADAAWEAAAAADRVAQTSAEFWGGAAAETGHTAAETGHTAAETGHTAAETGHTAAETGHEKLADQQERFLSHEGHKVLNDEDAAPYRTRLDGAPSGLAWTDNPQAQLVASANGLHAPGAAPADDDRGGWASQVEACQLCNHKGIFLDGCGEGLLYEMSTEDSRYSRNIECQHSLEGNLAEIRLIELGGKWTATKSCWRLIDDYFGHIYDDDQYDPVTGRIILADEDEYAYNW
ncbi:hypothetical protein OEM_13590 [Mycobacterium intracellulare subsp. yongonense 05-1390]|uniref:hypothetical protein n=1 Tax=Mycobacterium intracellulare TaxID=1767 RepID=UPI000355835D|nr:hypothetical protein [Mycobacterium intracellulare]AGP62894.1 hypothetical protein OEM_13590 [Mycobacterium intracellulare subsp. yongonense 05-1390]